MDASEATPGPRRSGQWFGHPATAAIAAVAAAVFVVVGFISFDRPGDSGSGAKSAGDSLAVAEAAAQGHFLGDIGEIGDPKRLRSAIAEAATGDGAATDSAELAPESGGNSSLPSTDSDREAVGHCAQVTQLSLDAAADKDGSEGGFTSTLTFSAVGKYKNAPAVILVYTTKSGGQQVFVVARNTCTILTFQGTPGSP